MVEMKRQGSRWLRSLKTRIAPARLRQTESATNQAQRSHASTGSLNVRIATSLSISAIESLEMYFREGGVSIVQAAFERTYFVHPDNVRERTPYYPNRARFSRIHYPGLNKGSSAQWQGDGREVRLDDNQFAQIAWEGYTGHPIARGSGYGLRHIWGNPWNPDAFTAGWNFCYMPFWAGMLTERQHPHPQLEKAIRQASWDLYFSNNPVCRRPVFVENPGLDLASLLDGQALLILRRGASRPQTRPRPRPTSANSATSYGNALEHIKAIRTHTRQSWVNIYKASRLLQGKEHEPFGTHNVENGAKSCVRKINRETGLSFSQIENVLDQNGLGHDRR